MKDIPFTVELEEAAAAEAKPVDARRPERGNGEEPPVLSVAQLTRRIRGLLEESFGTVTVEGELSNVKRAASGHLYFSLKDDEAQIRCVMFRAAASALRFEPEDGLQVVLRGRLSVYEARGEYQIQVLVLEPRGVGALQLAFEQLKRKLEAEGLFDPAHKEPLPFLPRRVGIVTSPQGAAIRDMLHVLERRFSGMPVLVYPTAVQGDAAAGEIAEGIATLNRIAAVEKIDLIIVGRGGGSVEDLWAFNTEVVARAIHAADVPIISAVGHEVDFTIADFVADVRAPSPSAAAELAVPLKADLLVTVNDLRERILQGLEREIALCRERWTFTRARLGSPEGLIRQMVQRVDDQWERVRQAGVMRFERSRERHLQGYEKIMLLRPDRQAALHLRVVRDLVTRLGPAQRRHLGQLQGRVQGMMELLESLSPLTVINRGFGMVQRMSGEVVRSVGEVAVGESVAVRLRDGSLDAQIHDIHPNPEATAATAPTAPTAKRERRRGPPTGRAGK